MPSDKSGYEEHPIDPEKGLQFASNAVKENLEFFLKRRKSEQARLVKHA